jgi:protein-disulfide isomerase
VTVVVVVLGIIGVAVYAKSSSSSSSASGSTSTATADPSAPSPKGALPATDDHAYGITYGTATNVPVLAIWEDFQCPACDQVEKANGAGIESLADSGKIQLVWRPTTFLDNNLKNDSSSRAAAAWGCAVDAGKAKEYHNTVFANQPSQEGAGYTDDQLIQFATDSGITGTALDTFKSCFAAKTYLGWAGDADRPDRAREAGGGHGGRQGAERECVGGGVTGGVTGRLLTSLAES